MTRRVLVTGGRGLLGNAVIDDVLARGWHVSSLQRTPSGKADGERVREVLGTVTDRGAVDSAIAGCDTVVHLAARVGIEGGWRDFESVNVEGTRVVLAAAERASVSGFVQVSSPSVAHAGKPLVGAGADPADPSTARGHYARSKAMAERIVLDQSVVPVVAIRPHLVWGPGDTQLIGRIVQRAKAGRLFLIGGGNALIDTTYIDNAASAIGAALDRIVESDNQSVRGRAFVVSNGEPRPVRDIINAIVRSAGLETGQRSVPFVPAYVVGGVVETALAPMLTRRGIEPPVTRFLVEQLATAHWFDQRGVREALAWYPQVSLDEGMERLAAWYASGVATAAEPDRRVETRHT